MKIIKKNQVGIGKIVQQLKDGKVIVYPTETCYGLGCDAETQSAVDRIFDIKKRQRDKPMLVVMKDLAMVRKYVNWNDDLQQLADKYWPGPLTLVTEVKPDHGLAENGLIAEDNTLAFRISSYPFVQNVLQKLGCPLVSTSANISSHDSPYDIETVVDNFGDQDEQPDVIVDAGSLSHQSPSTIVKVTNNNLEIVRQGELVINEGEFKK